MYKIPAIKKSTKKLFQQISSVAEDQGAEIYAVGGFVRDLILGREVKDIDFVVIGDALLIAAAFKKRHRIQAYKQFPRFGTCMFQYGSYHIELVSARSESYHPESRKPVIEHADLYADLSRRDFTINAMALMIDRGETFDIIDPFHGFDDLTKRCLRTPLNPVKTFSDDPLRMLRAIRFATTLNFTIEKKTLDAIKKDASRLKIVSQERITDEFNKILVSAQPSAGLRLLDSTNLLKHFLPEFIETKGTEQRDEYHHKDVFDHTLQIVDKLAESGADLKLRLAAMLHDIAKPRTKRFNKEIGWTFHGHEVVGERMADLILKRMKYPRIIIDYVKKLVRLHLRPMVLVGDEVTDSAVRRLLFLADEDFDDLMILCRADITSKNPETVSRHLNNYKIVLEKARTVEEKDQIRNFRCPVDGSEIMQRFNLSPGPRIGKIKKFLEEAILDGKIANEHDEVLKYMLDHENELVYVDSPE